MSRMQNPPDRILLRVSVEISDNHNDEILVFERDVEDSDGPALLATEFCRKHNLDPKKVHAPLKEHIMNNLGGIRIGTRTKKNKKAFAGFSSRNVFNQRLKSAPRGNLNPALANGTSRSSRAAAVPKKSISSSASLPGPFMSQRPLSSKKEFAAPSRSSQHTAAAAPKGPSTKAPTRHTHTPTPTPRISTSRPSSAPRASSTMTPRPSSTAGPVAAPLMNGMTVTKGAHGFSRANSTTSAAESVDQRASPPAQSELRKISTGRNSARVLLRTKSGPGSTGAQSARGTTNCVFGNQANAGVRSGSQSARQAPRVRAASVFDKLYADAAVKSVKLETMRAGFIASLEKSQEGVAASQTKTNKPGSRPSSADPGRRLYSEAQRRKEKFEALREKQTQVQARKEMEEVTLRPQINESQRRVLGLPSRFCADDFSKKRSAVKMERLRQESEEKIMRGCTFRPEIDERSNAMMENRLSRLKIEGTLHDHLYDDAKRREGRYSEYYNRRATEATFCPDIGLDHFRPPNDDTDQDFLNRLAYSKSGTTRKNDRSPSHAGESDFHPKTGRPPNSARNANGLPIGDFLYNAGRERTERREQKQQNMHAQEEQRKEQSMSSTSKQKFDSAKQRKFDAMFKILSNGGSEITANEVSLEGFDPETAEFIQPVIQFVKRENSRLNFDDFCVAMDYAIENSVTPVGHLFVDHARRVPVEEPTFAPRVSKKSGELAKNRPRDISLPLYDQLCAENDAYEASRQRKIQERADDLLKECTFQPNLDRQNGHHRGAPRPEAVSGPLRADNNQSRSDPNLRNGTRGAYGYRAQVDAAEAAVRRCRDVVEKAKHAVEGMYV
eukprot:GEMP01017946.1.p1 GENE.GEMP01017946.1~~GEMP01017946.1.p1  ORF type:complete len:840 (+),score=208.72 GEMP01017946.1:147-2666(+)